MEGRAENSNIVYSAERRREAEGLGLGDAEGCWLKGLAEMYCLSAAPEMGFRKVWVKRKSLQNSIYQFLGVI